MVDIFVLGIALREEGKTPLLLLRPHDSQTILTLDVGPMEAFAVSIALHGRTASRPEKESAAGAERFSRPLPHDLVAAILHALEARLLSVRLTSVVDDACTAEAILAQAGRKIVINCRPSDGIAAALRCGAPIRASRSVTAHARAIDKVMAMLPKHARAGAAAKLAGLFSGGPRAGTRPRDLPKADGNTALTGFWGVEVMLPAGPATAGESSRQEEARADRGAPGEAQSKDRAMPDAGFERLPGAPEKTAPRRLRVNAHAPGPQCPAADLATPAPDCPAKERCAPSEAPQIRVSFAQHKRKDTTATVDESVAAGKKSRVPGEILAGLGLSPHEAAAVTGAPDEERWTMLLRILAPQTKVLM